MSAPLPGCRCALQDVRVGPLAERRPVGPAAHQARHLPVPHALAVRLQLRSRLCLVPGAAGPVLRNRCRESSLASVRNLCAAMKVRIRDESWRADRRNRDARIAGCMKARNLFVRRAMAAHISECRTQCMRAPCDGTRHGQGIPIDDLLLTRERENQLTSLSGNAMTTTVILCRPPTHSSHAPQLSALRCCFVRSS